MMKDYLEKYYNLLLEKKVNLEDEFHRQQIEIEKYSDRILTLENDSKESLLGFSPHIVDEDESEEICNYRSIIDSCKEKSKQIQKSIQDVEIEMKQLFSVIENEKKKEKEISDKKEKQNIEDRKDMEDKKEKQDEANKLERALDSFLYLFHIQEVEKRQFLDEIENTVVRNMNSIENRIRLLSNLLDVDPVRCKLELKVILQIIEKVFSEFNDILYKLNPITLSENVEFESLMNKMFEYLKVKNNKSIDFLFSMEENLDRHISLVLKLHILYLVNEIYTIIFKNAFVYKIHLKVSLINSNIHLLIVCNGKNIDTSIFEKNVEKYVVESELNKWKEQLEFLSGKIEVKNLKTDEKEIQISFPFEISN